MSGTKTLTAPDAQQVKAKEIADIKLFAQAGLWARVKDTIIASPYKEVWVEGMHALKQGFNYEWRTLAAIAGQRDNAGAAKCAVEALIEKHDWNVVNGICATGLPEVGKHAVDTVFKEGNRVAMEGIAKYGSPEVSEYARQKLKEMKEEK